MQWQVAVRGDRPHVELLAAIGAVTVAEQPELLEHVEGAIDGRGDGRRVHRPAALDEVGAGDVTIGPGQDIDERAALRGPAEPPLAEWSRTSDQETYAAGSCDPIEVIVRKDSRATQDASIATCCDTSGKHEPPDRPDPDRRGRSPERHQVRQRRLIAFPFITTGTLDVQMQHPEDLCSPAGGHGDVGDLDDGRRAVSVRKTNGTLDERAVPRWASPPRSSSPPRCSTSR